MFERVHLTRIAVRLVLSMLSAASILAPPAAAAAVPWTTYEAERATTSGEVIGPDYTGSTPAREASGRQCVRLSATGQSLQFTSQTDANAMVVRYCLPDDPSGPGTDATLSLYVNGRRTKLAMTSRYSHLYGPYPWKHRPAVGPCRNFWDEVRTMPGDVRRGDVVRLQKDADDAAAEYWIDFVDLEAVPPPLPQPPGSLSVMDFGAAGTGTADDRPALLAAIAVAQPRHVPVWIPPGRFLLTAPVEVANVAVAGAGMWYTTLIGGDDYRPGHRLALIGQGSGVTLSDLSLIGRLTYRNDDEPNDGIGGTFGQGSALRNLWVEHTKTGAWLVNSAGLTVDGCRFRDTIADGINLCLGMRDTTVRHCTARGTGDDCFAIWPADYAPSTSRPGRNRFEACTAQLPFLAQGFAVYGGEANAVHDCDATDICYGAGLLASTTFPTEIGFEGVTTFADVRITRAGHDDGALGVVAGLRDLSGLDVQRVQITDSPTDGIKLAARNGHSITDTTFDSVQIDNPAAAAAGGHAIHIPPGVAGTAVVKHMTVTPPGAAPVLDESPQFNLIQQ